MTPQVFVPSGPTFTVHRDEERSLGIDFTRALDGADPEGATVAVTFWRKANARYVPAQAGTFDDPEPVWDPGQRTARFWLRRDNGPAPAGFWGIKIALTTTDGQVYVADCPLVLLGAMSEED